VSLPQRLFRSSSASLSTLPLPHKPESKPYVPYYDLVYRCICAQSRAGWRQGAASHTGWGSGRWGATYDGRGGHRGLEHADERVAVDRLDHLHLRHKGAVTRVEVSKRSRAVTAGTWRQDVTPTPPSFLSTICKIEHQGQLPCLCRPFPLCQTYYRRPYQDTQQRGVERPKRNRLHLGRKGLPPSVPLVSPSLFRFPLHKQKL
jgi:hypothetical protein